MANLKVKNADGADVYLKASGTGSDGDPLVLERSTTIDKSGLATDTNQDTQITALAAIKTAVESALTTALVAGEAHIGEVGGRTLLVTPSITVSTTPAYSAGDSVGGKWTLSNAVRVSGGTGVLQSLMIVDRANQKPAGTILIYNADPTSATLTDNAALVNSTDDFKVVAAIPVAAGDYVTINSKAFANLRNLGAVLKPASGTTLYAAFALTSTPTFVATTDVQVTFGILAD